MGNNTSVNTIFSLTDGTTNNTIRAVYSTTNNLSRSIITTNSVSQINIDGFSRNIGLRSNLALAFKRNACAACYDGNNTIEDNSSIIPLNVGNLFIGSHLSNDYLNGYIHKISFYPYRLQNSQLESLTT